jgi:protein SCO1/2
MVKRQLVVPVVASLILVVVLLLLLFWPAEERVGVGSKPAGGDFSLGEFALSSMRGSVVLLYFGYMSCPDICPTSLADMASVMRLLGDKERDQVRGLFVTVDPDRDRQEDLDRYAAYFHPNIDARRGSREEVDRAVALYGAFYRMVDHQSASGYQVDHSASIYLIDKQGSWVESFDYATPPPMIAASVQRLLESDQ